MHGTTEPLDPQTAPKPHPDLCPCLPPLTLPSSHRPTPGVLYERFVDMQKKMKGASVMLTPQQQEWLEAQRLGLRFKPMRKPRPPPDAWGTAAFDLCTAPTFENSVGYRRYHRRRRRCRHPCVQPTIPPRCAS